MLTPTPTLTKTLIGRVGELIPVALALLDDYQPSNKVIGLKILAHILKEANSTEVLHLYLE